MFAWIKKASAFLHQTFDKCMAVPDYNSRLIFLGTTIFTQALMVWHTAKYLHADVKDPNYPQIMLILLGGHGVTAFGRFMTKRVGEKQAADSGAAPSAGSDHPKG
jgi:hypothetical protein